MKSLKKVFLIMLIVVLFIGILAGCGSSSNESKGEDTNTSVKKSENDSSTVPVKKESKKFKNWSVNGNIT